MTLSILSRRLLLCGGASLSLLARPALAQPTYPSRPIRVVVGWSPGGGVDVIARKLGQKLSTSLGQPVVIENKAGGTGSIAAAEVARAAPDGYTLLALDNSYATLPYLFSQLPFDYAKAFRLISISAFAPLFLGVKRNAPYADLRALIAAARAKPDTVAYGTGGNGSVPHFNTLAFQRAAGVELFHVPFRGANEAVLAVLSGTVQMVMVSVASALGSLQSGDLRPLAISGTAWVAALPQAPTFAEAGFPGFEANAWYGLAAPQGTPDAIVDKLTTAMQAALAEPDMRQFLDELGALPGGQNPKQAATILTAETERWREIASSGGIERR
jgi:tripartite-type tricarboxylate transporter receptor subunit TctC